MSTVSEQSNQWMALPSESGMNSLRVSQGKDRFADWTRYKLEFNTWREAFFVFTQWLPKYTAVLEHAKGMVHWERWERITIFIPSAQKEAASQMTALLKKCLHPNTPINQDWDRWGTQYYPNPRVSLLLEDQYHQDSFDLDATRDLSAFTKGAPMLRSKAHACAQRAHDRSRAVNPEEVVTILDIQPQKWDSHSIGEPYESSEEWAYGITTYVAGAIVSLKTSEIYKSIQVEFPENN